ncbi:MAG: CHASE2 and HATPase_c domain-containing protein [Acidobacteriota bacterium]|nr:CHASE2 and HATPase_c domain-containing protein [Acidobacteriota bacterium]
MRASNHSRYLILGFLILASGFLGVAVSWTSFGQQFDKYAYDFIFRLEPPHPWQPTSIILAIDQQTILKYGYPSGLRPALADGLDRIQPAHPAAVAVDVTLDRPGDDKAIDARLANAFSRTPNLVLSCDLLLNGGGWDDPSPLFRKYAVSIGQTHAALDTYDAVSRDLILEKIAGHDRRWALALAAYSAAAHADIVESPDDLAVGPISIPSAIRDEQHQRGTRALPDERMIRIRYVPPSMGHIPQVSIADLDRDPSLASKFANKVVFAGVTDQTAVQDRWMTPYSSSIFMPGVEIHANAYETIARQMFLTDASPLLVLPVSLAMAAGAGLAYAFAGGWIANVLALLVLLCAQLIPAISFAHSVVWPWAPATLAVVLATAGAAAWRHLLVRRELVHAEHEKTRYQHAMQFVTHEMRTPLTAIQGSSELISRYGSMPEAKRTQMADLINSESKRLARMIETFLSMERISFGQMELREERFPLPELVEQCAVRARALADHKQIEIKIDLIPPDELIGDRELMEYAVYNLLTNAVKYSPPRTRVTVFGENGKGGRLRLSIQDEGIGMDKKEIGHIFDKFYRTRKAEQSGEMGTGIGLSIVKQIVTGHGGTIHVESAPGKGSKFTLNLKRAL